MLLLRSAMRQPRNGNLNQPIRMHHAYGVDALLNIRLIKAPHTECLITIIPCYVISNKFPRLLAEREIIANAFVYQRCLGNGSSQIHLQRYNNLLKRAHLSSKNFYQTLPFFFFRCQQTALTTPKYTLIILSRNKEGIAI